MCVHPLVYHSSQHRPDKGADPHTLGSVTGSLMLPKLSQSTAAEHVDLHQVQLWAREKGKNLQL